MAMCDGIQLRRLIYQERLVHVSAVLAFTSMRVDITDVIQCSAGSVHVGAVLRGVPEVPPGIRLMRLTDGGK
jgi:hypothetical protein